MALDLTSHIQFRNFDFNDAVVVAGVGRLLGCATEFADDGNFTVQAFHEKRTRADGSDFGPVLVPVRHLKLIGTLYGSSRGDLFDRAQDMARAMSPRIAYLDDETLKGVAPLTAAHAGDFNSVVYDARTLGLQQTWERSKTGGDDTAPLALAWQAQWIIMDQQVAGA